MVDDLGLRHHPPGVQEQVAEQVELRRRQLDRLATTPHLVRVLVHLQIGKLEAPRLLGLPTPPQHRMHPGDELLETERLGHVIVGTHRQAVHLCLSCVARR